MTSPAKAFKYLEDLLKAQKYIEYPPACIILPNKSVQIYEEPSFPTPAFHEFPFPCYEDKTDGTRLPLVPLVSITPTTTRRRFEVVACYTSPTGQQVFFPPVWVDLNKPTDVICPLHYNSADQCPCLAYVPPHASLFRRESFSCVIAWKPRKVDIEAATPRQRTACARGELNHAYWSAAQRVWILIPPLVVRRPPISLNASRHHRLPRATLSPESLDVYITPLDITPSTPTGLVPPSRPTASSLPSQRLVFRKESDGYTLVRTKGQPVATSSPRTDLTRHLPATTVITPVSAADTDAAGAGPASQVNPAGVPLPQKPLPPFSSLHQAPSTSTPSTWSTTSAYSAPVAGPSTSHVSWSAPTPYPWLSSAGDQYSNPATPLATWNQDPLLSQATVPPVTVVTEPQPAQYFLSQDWTSLLDDPYNNTQAQGEQHRPDPPQLEPEVFHQPPRLHPQVSQHAPVRAPEGSAPAHPAPDGALP